MPVAYDRGVLYVWVKSSPAMQQMTYFASMMREKINKFVGRAWIKSIRFTLDRKSVPLPEENDEGLRDFLAKQFPNEDVDR